MEELLNSGGLVLSGLPCQGASQLLDLFNSCWMPGTQAFGGDGDEFDALLSARLPGLVQLSLLRYFQGVAGGESSVTGGHTGGDSPL